MSGFALGAGTAAPVAPAAGTAAAVFDVTTKTFAKEVIEASRQAVVLVDFWAPWCGPCKQLTPVLEKVVKASGGRARLAKMNIDEHPQVAGQLGIQSIPAVIAFKDGRPLDGFMGALPESQVKQFVDRVAGPAGPTDVEQMLEAASAALAEGAFEDAAGAFAAVLEEEPENVPAVAGLVRSLVGLKDLASARELLARVPAAKAKDPAIAGARAQLELAEGAESLGDASALDRRVRTDPLDHAARYDLALALNAQGDRKGAAEHLVEIVRRDREWNEGAARRQLLQFFEAWGNADPATVSGRRRLSSVLFS